MKNLFFKIISALIIGFFGLASPSAFAAEPFYLLKRDFKVDLQDCRMTWQPLDWNSKKGYGLCSVTLADARGTSINIHSPRGAYYLEIFAPCPDSPQQSLKVSLVAENTGYYINSAAASCKGSMNSFADIEPFIRQLLNKIPNQTVSVFLKDISDQVASEPKSHETLLSEMTVVKRWFDPYYLRQHILENCKFRRIYQDCRIALVYEAQFESSHGELDFSPVQKTIAGTQFTIYVKKNVFSDGSSTWALVISHDSLEKFTDAALEEFYDQVIQNLTWKVPVLIPNYLLNSPAGLFSMEW